MVKFLLMWQELKKSLGNKQRPAKFIVSRAVIKNAFRKQNQYGMGRFGQDQKQH